MMSSVAAEAAGPKVAGLRPRLNIANPALSHTASRAPPASPDPIARSTAGRPKIQYWKYSRPVEARWPSRYPLHMRTNMTGESLVSSLRALWEDRRGQDMVEYTLLGAFVASVAIAVFPAVTTTEGAFNQTMSLPSVA